MTNIYIGIILALTIIINLLIAFAVNMMSLWQEVPMWQTIFICIFGLPALLLVLIFGMVFGTLSLPVYGLIWLAKKSQKEAKTNER